MPPKSRAEYFFLAWMTYQMGFFFCLSKVYGMNLVKKNIGILPSPFARPKMEMK